MKKNVEIAFAITLVILSIIATIYPYAIIQSIVYAVVLPSFVLTLISFVTDIAVGCEKNASKQQEQTEELSNLTKKIADIEMESYKKGLGKDPYIEGKVPKDIYDQAVRSNEYLRSSVEYAHTRVFFLKCKRICDIVVVIGYIMLFVSLCLSPIIAKWLSEVNLNCITMWSLAILYITQQLKDEVCALIFNKLHKISQRHLKIDAHSEDNAIELSSDNS